VVWVHRGALPFSSCPRGASRCPVSSSEAPSRACLFVVLLLLRKTNLNSYFIHKQLKMSHRC
jgi:hypothetical protein